MKKIVFCLMVLFISHSFSAHSQDKVSSYKINEIRTVPDSVVEKMKKDKDFAYANDMSYWEKRAPSERSWFDRMMSALSGSVALKFILYSLLVAAIIFALYQVMVVNNFFILSRAKRNRKVKGETVDESINENLDEKIKEAIDKKNYRHAIRFMYLKTLKVLSDNNLIMLHAKSTNQDYIRQLYNYNNLGQFRQLTRIYEYVWYGEFDPTEIQFDIIKTNFNRFNQNS
jgi:hypothetical protein